MHIISIILLHKAAMCSVVCLEWLSKDYFKIYLFNLIKTFCIYTFYTTRLGVI